MSIKLKNIVFFFYCIIREISNALVNTDYSSLIVKTTLMHKNFK